MKDASAQIIKLDEVRADRGASSLGSFRPTRTAERTDATSDGSIFSGQDQNPVPIVSKKPSGERLVFSVACIASFILHATLIAAAVWRAPQLQIGAGGQELDAVSVEIVTASALESAASKPNSAPAGQLQPAEGTPGISAPVEQSEIVQTTPAPTKSLQQTEAIVKPDETPLTKPDLLAAPQVVPLPKEQPKTTPEEKKPEEDNGKDQPASVAQPAIIMGGYSSRASSNTNLGESAAVASPGQMAHYALEVRISVGRSRPKHNGGRGRVQIGFGLTDGGELRFVEIVNSSGNADLDFAAMTAVRQAVFPRPPVGSTDTDRTYVVPFDFK